MRGLKLLTPSALGRLGGIAEGTAGEGYLLSAKDLGDEE